MLKLNTASERAPATIFTVPDRARDLFHNVEDIYNLWYKVYVDSYVPLLAQRSKWNDEHENVKVDDIVYFKIKDSPLHAKWLIGKVEFIVPSRDKKVRTVGIGYKYDTENGERKFKIVERPVREIVKLQHIDETSIIEDIKNVQVEARKLFDSHKIVTDDELFDVPSIASYGACDYYQYYSNSPSHRADSSFFVYTSRNEPIKRENLCSVEEYAYMTNCSTDVLEEEEVDDERNDLNWFFDTPINEESDDNDVSLALI